MRKLSPRVGNDPFGRRYGTVVFRRGCLGASDREVVAVNQRIRNIIGRLSAEEWIRRAGGCTAFALKSAPGAAKIITENGRLLPLMQTGRRIAGGYSKAAFIPQALPASALSRHLGGRSAERFGGYRNWYCANMACSDRSAFYP